VDHATGAGIGLGAMDRHSFACASADTMPRSSSIACRSSWPGSGTPGSIWIRRETQPGGPLFPPIPRSERATMPSCCLAGPSWTGTRPNSLKQRNGS
jgi:hypothetical protein